MKTGKKGIQLIKEFESLHDGDLNQVGLQPKMCPAGIWTEGYGRAMRDKKGNFLKGIANRKIAESSATIKTEVEAITALAEDLSSREFIVMQKIKGTINQNQFDALVSHVYNTGGSDTLFKLINLKATDEQIYEWFTTKYTTANGKVLPGLVRRRKAEADLYFSK